MARGAAARPGAVTVGVGVDMGATWLRAAAVDLRAGRLRGPRLEIRTPSPSTPETVTWEIGRLVAEVAAATSSTLAAPLGIGVPTPVVGGRTMTAANIDHAWIGYHAVERISASLGRPVTVVNDADAAGVAEMRFGAGAGHRGVAMIVTLGTGIGTALFVEGRLVPNLELGHLELGGEDAEHRAAASAKSRRQLGWTAWAADLDAYLRHLDRLIWPDLFILGGGISRQAEKFIPLLRVRAPVVPARLRNDAGIIGAALVAAERT